MPEESCPLPSVNRSSDAQVLARLLKANRIAVVGLSADTTRAAWRVAQYLREVGKEIIPVNPLFPTLMGLTCYPGVSTVPGRVDLVNVFRRAEFCPGVVEDAIAACASGVWLQSGIVSIEARRLSDKAGIDYVEDRCLMVEHMHAR
jgi:predicted CoA-binding protein